MYSNKYLNACISMHANVYVHIHAEIGITDVCNIKRRLTLLAFDSQTSPSQKISVAIALFLLLIKKLGIKTQSILLQVKWDICLRQ